jgi:hypothetical protein
MSGELLAAIVVTAIVVLCVIFILSGRWSYRLQKVLGAVLVAIAVVAILFTLTGLWLNALEVI